MPFIKDRLYSNAARHRIPLTCALEISPVCNFRCKMCYVRKSKAEVEEFGGLRSVGFWLDLAEQLRQAGTLFPLITGGEPLLYADFWQLYASMCQMGMHVSINSNASCIDEKAISHFLQNPPERINITLYGGSNETYDRLCGAPHGFEQVTRAVQLLSKHGLRFKFNCSLTPDNCGDVERMLDFARRYDHGIQFATYMFPPVRRTGLCGDYDARFSPQQAAYYHVLTDWLQLPHSQFQTLAWNMQHFQELTPERIAEASNGEPGSMRCMAGRCSAWIDWKGCLSVCGIFDQPAVSLDELSFEKAWQEVTSWASSHRFSPVCANCINRAVCYSCPAKIFNETGGYVERPAYICEMRRYEKEYYREFLQRLPEAERVSCKSNEGPIMDSCALEEL